MLIWTRTQRPEKWHNMLKYTSSIIFYGDSVYDFFIILRHVASKLLQGASVQITQGSVTLWTSWKFLIRLTLSDNLCGAL